MTGSPIRYGPGDESPGPSVIRERSSCLRSTIGVGLGAALLLAGPSALAQEIRVNGGNCASGVHLVAREARLADVLKRLAQALDFQLSFESENNPLVTVDAKGTPTELVARLAPFGNISMTQARNPGCPPRERIVNVWVLPNSPGGPTQVAATSPQATQAQEEQARKEQEGFDLVLKSHGVAPAHRAPTESK
jgi:hypothetical protein